MRHPVAHADRSVKPRIFLGSSGKQRKLVQAVAHGLAEVAEVEPWTTVFHPGVSTRLRWRPPRPP